MLRKSGLPQVWIAILVLSLTGQFARAQRNEGRVERPHHFSGQQAPVVVNQSIDENKQTSLPGNTRPEATPQNDGGAVPDNYFLDHMLLQLKRSAEQEQALQQYLQEVQTKGSPNYQHWLSAQEFGERFGVSHIDIETLTRWLEKHGLTVNVVYPSGMVIDFSGTAKQVRNAFHTDIHRLHVKGKNHISNINDPKIPAALAPVVAGIVSLNDFAPHTMHEMRKSGSFTFNDPLGGTAYAVAPQDLATIYNLNPLFNAGNSGQGQTVVVIEDTDIFSKADWTAFRSKFGLSKYTSGSFRTVYPAPVSGVNNCRKPGIVAPNDAEAILDAEWASAAAPSAAIEMATCADTTATFGGLIAIQNLINASTLPPAIMSVSYGQCEAENGAAANAAYNSAYQQAVAEGVSVFVAAGDSGAAGCDNSVAQATHGIGVNAFASTPYNVAVGGTDFSDTYSGTNSTYWNSSNTFNFGSARSYIPEIPWNDSCAGALFASYEGFNVTAGPSSFCNDPTYGSFVQSTVAGGGGPSACATGSPNVSGIVGGSCQGWPKPAWQAIAGNPNDGVRDTPDVSLFAADGLWSHYYIFCWSDTANGGAACTGSPSGWSGAGGTSFASPIMAGIQALVNQKTAARQGNPNPAYYQLAANEYNTSLGNACNSSNGASAPSNCVFHDVTQGDMDVNCVGSANCFLDGSPAGVLSTSNSSFQPAYPAGSGWDFATGIGSVNAANLVNSWPGTAANFTVSTSASSVSVTQGASSTTTVTVTPWNGFNGSVSFAATGLPSGVTAAFNPSSSQSATTLTLTASSTAAVGTANVTVTGTSGSLTNSTTLSVTVNSEGTFSLSASPASLTVAQGASGSSTISIAAQGGFSGRVSLSASGLPSGVTASFNPSSTATSSSLMLTAASTAPTGNATVTITGTSGGLTNTTAVSLAVVPAPTFTLSVSPNGLSMSQGASGATTVSVLPQAGFTGAVTLTASGLPAGVAATFSPAVTTTASTLTLTASSTAATGLFAVTITGTSGSLSKTTTLNVSISSPPLLTSWLDQDVGAVGVAGNASYSNGTFTVNGSGQQIWGTADGMNYMYQPLSGDGSIVARVLSLQGGTSTQAAGVMIRETLAAGSTNVYAGYSAQGVTFVDFRSSTGGATSTQQSQAAVLPNWVQLVRSGNTFTGYSSIDGVNWTQMGASQSVSMAQNVYIGVAVGSATNSALATAKVDNVSVNFGAGSAPVLASVSATTGNIGSQVVISGSGFGAAQNGGAVFLNETALTVNSWSASSITVTVPAGATSGPLAVSAAPSMNYSNPVTFTVTAQPLPNGWLDQDVGTVGIVGSATYANGTFTVQASGNQIWGNADQMHFVYHPWSGDATIVARAVSLQGGASTQGTGVMVRETLTTSSANVIAGFGQGISFLDDRSSTAGSTATQQGGPAGLPDWVKLVRSGDTFTAFTSPDGMNWTQIGPAQTIHMAANVYIGMAVSSASNLELAGATFDNVSLSSPTSPNFALSASPASVNVVQGGSATTTISIAPQNGFSGTVNLAVSGLPAGVTAAFNPSGTSSSSLLTLTADSSAAAGNFTATITGNSGTLTNMTTVGVNVVVPPSFTLSAAPSSLSVVQGTNGTATITIAGQNGFTGTVSLSASGLPAGVTATFNPASATTSSTLTLAASSSAALGNATITVTGTSGSLTATTSVALTITATPSFTFSAAPGSLSVVQGTSGTATINIAGQNGFTGTVSLSASGLPAGVTATFSPASATTSSTLTLAASSSAALGNATITVTGTSGSQTATTSVALTVTAAPSFTLTATPGSLSVVQGISGAITVSIGALNGFSGTVSLSAAGLPAGVTATFNPASATTSSTLTLVASSSATTGTVNVTINGSSGTLSGSTMLALTVTVPASGLPSGWTNADVGSVAAAGSATFSNGTFAVNASGQQIWGTADGFNFTYQQVTGDTTVVARMITVGGGATSESTGVMIRETLAAGSTNVYAAFSSGALLYFDDRPSTGGNTASQNTASSVALPYWVKIVRSGNIFSGYSSVDGVNWTQIGSSVSVPMAANVYVGLAVSSNEGNLANASFDNVSLTVPAPPAFTLAASPSPLNIAQGATGASTISITPQSGFSGSVNLSIAGLPAGVTASFNPASASTSSVLTLTVGSSAAVGSSSLTITGVSGASGNVTTTLALNVTQAGLPAGWSDSDVGGVGTAGNATFGNGTFTVKGAGSQIWGTADGFNFASQQVSGDSTVIARMITVSGGATSESTGVMIRETLTGGSSNVYATFSSGALLYFDDRPSTGGNTASQNSGSGVSLPYWIKIMRQGNTFSGYSSVDGLNWTQIGTSVTVNMATNVYVGLAVSSNSGSLATATFDNVAVTTP